METARNNGIECAKSLIDRLAAVHTLELEEYEQLISAQNSETANYAAQKAKKLLHMLRGSPYLCASKFTERMFSFADLSKSAAAAKMTVCIAEFENQTSMRNVMF